MSDLIDRQNAIDVVAFGITYTKVFDKETGKVKVKDLFAEGNYELKNAIDRIKKLPSVDAVEVVRCKDCVYSRGFATFACPMVGRVNLKDNDFCSRGERRTDEISSAL